MNMKKFVAVGLLLLVMTSCLSMVSADDRDNLDDYVNVGKRNTAYLYDYKVEFYDSNQNKLQYGNKEGTGCRQHNHAFIPDDAEYYKVHMKVHAAGATWGESEYIPAWYISTGQPYYTVAGERYKNTGIFTAKGTWCSAYCDYALEQDAGIYPGIHRWSGSFDWWSGSFEIF